MLDTVPVTGHDTPTVRNGLPCLMQYFPTSFFSHRTCVTPSQNSNMLLTSVLQKKNWSPSMMEQQALSIISKQICTESINQLVINGGGWRGMAFRRFPTLRLAQLPGHLTPTLVCKKTQVAKQSSWPGRNPSLRKESDQTKEWRGKKYP